MGSLNQDASAVVRAGRKALQATGADRDRVEAALSARLGPHAFPPQPALASGTKLAAWRVAAGATIGACAVGGALFFATRAEPTAAPQASVGGLTAGAANTTKPQPVEVAPTHPPAVDEPEAPTLPEASEPAVPSPSLTTRRQDALTKEVALMSRAVSALNAGRPGQALVALNEHQRLFPNGLLGTERRAAKAQALCSLGRLSEGRAELGRLSPQSPAAGRARQVCDSVAARGQRDKP